MEILVALQAALKVIVREISLSNFGMYQDMTDTKSVGLFFIHKVMVCNRSHSFDKHPIVLM